MELAELRAKLDRLNEQIVSRLKDRAWFALNPAVYTPGAIPVAGRPGLSFMEWSLEGLERYHASLGRFELPDQHPLLPEVVGPSPVQRPLNLPRLPAIALPPRDQLVNYYVSILPRLCRPGDDPHYYGETAYADADLLARINERIYLGAFVAYSKLAHQPDIVTLVAQPDALRGALRDPQREDDVITRARAAAERYGLDAGLVAEVFTWIIAQTLDLEVRFVQQVAASQAQPLTDR